MCINQATEIVTSYAGWHQSRGSFWILMANIVCPEWRLLIWPVLLLFIKGYHSPPPCCITSKGNGFAQTSRFLRPFIRTSRGPVTIPKHGTWLRGSLGPVFGLSRLTFQTLSEMQGMREEAREREWARDRERERERERSQGDRCRLQVVFTVSHSLPVFAFFEKEKCVSGCRCVFVSDSCENSEALPWRPSSFALICWWFLSDFQPMAGLGDASLSGVLKTLFATWQPLLTFSSVLVEHPPKTETFISPTMTQVAHQCEFSQKHLDTNTLIS